MHIFIKTSEKVLNPIFLLTEKNGVNEEEIIIDNIINNNVELEKMLSHDNIRDMTAKIAIYDSTSIPILKENTIGMSKQANVLSQFIQLSCFINSNKVENKPIIEDLIFSAQHECEFDFIQQQQCFLQQFSFQQQKYL